MNNVLVEVISSMAISLFLTIVTEWIIAIIIGIRDKGDFFKLMLVNIITNPVVVGITKIAIMLSNNNKLVIILLIAILELSLIPVEGTMFKKYFKYNEINPYILALIINGLSFTIGELIQVLGLI